MDTENSNTRFKERDALFKEFLNDPEFSEAIEAINLLSETKIQKTKRKAKRKGNDENFKANIGILQYIGLEKRQSLRLRNKSPIFKEIDLPDEHSFTKNSFYYRNDSDVDDLEDVVYKIPKRRSNIKRAAPPIIIPVEAVTEDMINNIASRVSTKRYSDNGTSCHQCRQKTLDQKTSCRNADCVGVRGQFCGVCLANRYGEDAALALKNPNWHCPVCRGICNCSFCRARAGKRPTGILTPLAIKTGHKSVKEFLESLKGEGDYVEVSDDPRKLLGFTADLQHAQMGGGVKHPLTCSLHSDDLKKLCEDIEHKLSEMIDLDI